MRRLCAVLLPLFLCTCGPKGLQGKLLRAERKAGDCETHLDKAEQAMAQLEPEQAREHLEDAKTALLDADIDYYPEHGMLRDRYKADTDRLPAVEAERVRRDFEAKVQLRKEALGKARAKLDDALAALGKKELSGSQVDDAVSAREALEKELKEDKALEGKSAPYTADANAARTAMERAAPRIHLARQTVQFQEGPAGLHRDARERLKDAKEEKDLDDRLEAFVEARDAYRRCHKSASDLLAATPALEKVSVLSGERATTPKAIVSDCQEGAASAEKTLVALREKLKATAKASARRAPAPVVKRKKR